MKVLNLKDLILSVDFAKGHIASLIIRGRERIASPLPLFCIRLRGRNGNPVIVTAYDAKSCREIEDGAIYKAFPGADISVCVHLADEQGEAAWRIAVIPESDRYFVEYVDFPPINLPALSDNNDRGTDFGERFATE